MHTAVFLLCSAVYINNLLLAVQCSLHTLKGAALPCVLLLYR